MLKAKRLADAIEIAYLKEQLSKRRHKVIDSGDNFCFISCFDDEDDIELDVCCDFGVEICI